MGVESVVQKRGPLENLGIVSSDIGEALADSPEPGGLARCIHLRGKVRPMDDLGHLSERSVMRQPQRDERFEGTPPLIILVRIRRARGVEADRPVPLLQNRDLCRLDKEDLGRRIQEPSDQPPGRVGSILYKNSSAIAKSHTFRRSLRSD